MAASFAELEGAGMRRTVFLMMLSVAVGVLLVFVFLGRHPIFR
jgi:hypothetical protein